MEFEFDPAKSAANYDKHGISFVEAQELWEDWGLEKQLPFVKELRWMRIVRFEERLWTIIYTRRQAKIRLISVRRSRKDEVNAYDSANRRGVGHDSQP